MHDSDVSTFIQKCDNCIDNVLNFAKSHDNKIDEGVLNFAESLSVKYNCDSKSLKHYFIYNSKINIAINTSLYFHNQYFDIVIAAIIGLFLLLSYFVIPIVLFIGNKNYDNLFFYFYS